MKSINRRTMLTSSILAAGAAAMGADQAEAQRVQITRSRRIVTQEKDAMLKRYPNEYFYDENGKFLPERGKEAMYEMFKFYGYPIVPLLKSDDFWVLDFGLGDFANCGMGGIFWVNIEKYSYFGHEIYLLPGQMIPEHHHIKTDFPPKMESWQVRHGSAFNFGEGEVPNATPREIPASQRGKTHCTQCEFLVEGDIRHLEVEESWHFLMGGENGAIITEYATYHDNAGVKFSNPDAVM